jgi:hypothetical protein
MKFNMRKIKMFSDEPKFERRQLSENLTQV